MADLELTVLDENNLDLVLPWFDDDKTRLALGDRDWPRQALRLMETQPGTTDDDLKVNDRVVWVAFEQESPVGLIHIETYSDGSAGFAVVVSPTHRRRGLCVRLIRLAVDHPRVASVKTWFAGVDVDNEASIRCLMAAGFTRRSEQPDHESMLRYEFIKAPTTSSS